MSNWRKYSLEFLSIFIAVISAFALNNWNENRRASQSENKILLEISNGLEKDLEDITLNVTGHQEGISACAYFKNLIAGKEMAMDSLLFYYFHLTRDFISVQNIAGYETLKSKGLELIKNDSLRLQIISLYEYDYNTLRKLEEEYSEMQFHVNYFKALNESIAPNFKFDSSQNIAGIDLPLKLNSEKKKILLIYLWKIQVNRSFIMSYYADIESKIKKIQKNISEEMQG